jgi:hypothetical protein
VATPCTGEMLTAEGIEPRPGMGGMVLAWVLEKVDQLGEKDGATGTEGGAVILLDIV